MFCASAVFAQDNTSDKRWNFYVGAGYAMNDVTGTVMKGSMHGMAVDARVAYQLTKDLPLDAFVGIKIGWSWKDENDARENIEYKQHIHNIDVPVGLQYRWSLNDNITLVPSAAINLRRGLSAEAETIIKGQYGTATTDIDMYDWDWKHHFEMGARFGLNVEYKHFYLGYAFIPNISGPKERDLVFSCTCGENVWTEKPDPRARIDSHLVTLGYHF